jgi:glycosyltransferase involved in cell wall biosynthesis
MNEKPPLSVCIITHNEEKNIVRTLQQVKDIAYEIIIVDSFSQDKTCELAMEFGAKVYKEEWNGFVDQKNSALEKCTQEWILMLDADEVVSDKLHSSIIRVINYPKADAYYINRKTHYLGKLMNYAWQPDWNLRLVKRSAKPVWKGNMVHESLYVNGNTGRLEGEMIHYSYTGIKHHFEKTIRYAEISAQSYFERGRRAGILNILLNPLYAFFRIYFLHKGVLDGVRGFIAAISSAFGTFLKYAFLWEKQISADK